MPDNLRHAQYGPDSVQIDSPQSIGPQVTALPNARMAFGSTGAAAGASTVLVGDSITNNCNLNNGLAGAANVTDQFKLLDIGWFNWMNIRLKNPFKVLYNFAVAGNTTADVLASVPAALALRPQYVILMAGINDINTGVSADTIIGNYSAIYRLAAAAGATVIHATIIVNTTINALGAGNPKVETFAKVNNWIRTKAANSGNVFVIDTFQALYDPTTVCGPLVGKLADSAHPGTVGASDLGTYGATILAGYFKPLLPNACTADLISPTLPEGNAIQYSVVAGTGGTAPVNTTNAGIVPAGWWMQDIGTSAGNSTYTGSQAARTDKPGKTWWQSVLTWTAAQATLATWSHRILAAKSIPAQLAAGTIVDCEIEVNLLAVTNAGALEVRFEALSAANAVLDFAGFNYGQGPTIQEPLFSGVIGVQGFVLPANTDKIMVRVIIRNAAATIGGCTLQIGDVIVRPRTANTYS